MKRQILGSALFLLAAGCLLEAEPDGAQDEAIHSLDIVAPEPAVPLPSDTAPRLPVGALAPAAPLDTAKPTPDPWTGAIPAKPTPDPWAPDETGSEAKAGSDSTSDTDTDTASETQAAGLPPNTN